MSPEAREALAKIQNSEASGINHDDIYGPGSLASCYRILAREYARHPQGHIVPDLSMLIRRLCHQLAKHEASNPVIGKAMAFLGKHGIQGQVIRTQ